MKIRLTLTLDLRRSRKTSEGSDPGDCVSVYHPGSAVQTGIGFTLPSTRVEEWE